MTAGPLGIPICVAAAIAAVVMTSCRVAQAADSPAPAAIVEILVLKDGERVSGTSIGIADGKLRWRMPYGSDLEIPFALIDRIEQLPADEVVVADDAAVQPASAVEKPSPAPEPLPAPEVKGAKEVKEASEAPVQQTAAVVPAVQSDPLPLTRAWYEAGRSTYAFAAGETNKWIKRFEVGGSWVEGNSQTSEAYVGGVFERQFKGISNQLDWNGRHATANGRVTQSRWQFNGTTDFSHGGSGKWILFLTHRHLFDQLADLDYRGSIAGGIGYRFINEGEKRLITRLGPGGTIEKLDPPIDWRITPDLFAEAEARWPIFDRTLLEYKSQFTPSLNEVGVFRMTSNYGVLVKLDTHEVWAMRFGLRHDHNSQTNPGKREDDFTTTFSLVYTRK